jgi:hypothetical protein
VTEMHRAKTTHDDDARFEFGLDLLMRGPATLKGDPPPRSCPLSRLSRTDRADSPDFGSPRAVWLARYADLPAYTGVSGA